RRAAEVEAARRLPADLLAQLVSAGCFRVLLPPSLGGAGADLVAALRVYETLSQADASVGWNAMIGSGVWLDLVGLPRATLDSLYGDGPDAMIAGVFNPTGVAVPVDGGYRVSGRWAFASGCSHSDWLYGNCTEEADGEQRFRTVLFAAAEVQIEDTWHVMGLRGTGSHHFTVDNVVAPAERTCATFEDEPAIDDPIVRIPVPSLLALAIASVAIGTGQGALDEITGVAQSRTPLLASSSLAASPLFQRDLSTADTELRAARALIHGVAGEAWTTACAGEELDLEQRARIRAAAVWAVSRASAVVRAAYHAGGGSALYVESPLQRRLRDIHAVTQHFLVRPDTMITAGAVLAGQDVDVPVL
ncbi:MAG: acyl-CoA dehydrogenase family protein, partial [Acidimicrobiia bacterium]